MTLQGVTLSNFRYQVTDVPGGGAGNSWLSTNWWYNDEYNRLLAGLAVIGWTRRRNGAAVNGRAAVRA